MLNACGRQFSDWSADYRLYERNRTGADALFAPVRKQLCEQRGPIVTALDDTILRKTGRKAHGVKFMRDPMGPAFRVNFVRAQRFLQISMACKTGDGQARMIPVDWMHAPVPQKPKADATATQRTTYQARKKACRISEVGVQRIRHLRSWFDANGAQARTLWTVGDGSFTNATVLKQLPENTVFVGRIRADAKLHHLPEVQSKDKGRKRIYGDAAPTPAQLRQEEKIPWTTVAAFFGGKRRKLRVKQLGPLRWRTAGQNHTLQLLVVAPTPYRLSKNARLLYREPAYLICTDPEASPEEVLQNYLWRWDIEVNFRDEKTILGVGDAQVRTPAAVQNTTACAVAAYAMLLAAAVKLQADRRDPDRLPAPKWHKKKSQRPTTMNLIKNLRYELWARSINFSGFITQKNINTKPEKRPLDLHSAIFYASRHS